MKNEKFLRGMGEIDDRILQRYDEIERRMAEPKPNRSHLVRWASLAACLCIIFTSVFFLQQKYGSDENPSVDVGVDGSEKITEVGTTNDGIIGGDVRSYKVVRPDDMVSFVANEAKNYRHYMDVSLFNVFNASFDKLSFIDNLFLYENPAIYDFTFDAEDSIYGHCTFSIVVKEGTEEEFKQTRTIVPLETALVSKKFDETLIDNEFRQDAYVSIGRAYYYYYIGGPKEGIKHIVFFVNGHMIHIGFRFNSSEDYVMRYPKGEVMENLSHLSTAPAQIEALIALWETAFPRMSEADIEEKIAETPLNQYKSYPNQHARPLSATLYKNGEVIEIDVNDPRLVRLVNFFNDSFDQKQFAQTVKNVSIDYLEENVYSEEFRLELKYEPCGEVSSLIYQSGTTFCNNMVVLNSGYGFVLINDNVSGYGGRTYAKGYMPYGGEYSWLDLFGF